MDITTLCRITTRSPFSATPIPGQANRPAWTTFSSENARQPNPDEKVCTWPATRDRSRTVFSPLLCSSSSSRADALFMGLFSQPRRVQTSHLVTVIGQDQASLHLKDSIGCLEVHKSTAQTTEFCLSDGPGVADMRHPQRRGACRTRSRQGRWLSRQDGYLRTFVDGSQTAELRSFGSQWSRTRHSMSFVQRCQDMSDPSRTER
jgi:hypothetical protein